mmetsp:Transcript_44234/g.102186  ORF Transcript_44234/g.102186 Transcript_44234/m.102186 type:complete len:204 (+) Transcript_44234:1949-2560(+)
MVSFTRSEAWVAQVDMKASYFRTSFCKTKCPCELSRSLSITSWERKSADASCLDGPPDASIFTLIMKSRRALRSAFRRLNFLSCAAASSFSAAAWRRLSSSAGSSEEALPDCCASRALLLSCNDCSRRFMTSSCCNCSLSRRRVCAKRSSDCKAALHLTSSGCAKLSLISASLLPKVSGMRAISLSSDKTSASSSRLRSKRNL